MVKEKISNRGRKLFNESCTGNMGELNNILQDRNFRLVRDIRDSKVNEIKKLIKIEVMGPGGIPMFLANA